MKLGWALAVVILLAWFPLGYCNPCPPWNATTWNVGVACNATSAEYTYGTYNLQGAKIYITSSVQLSLVGVHLTNVTFVSTQTVGPPSTQALLQLAGTTRLEWVTFRDITLNSPIVEVAAAANVELIDCQFTNNGAAALQTTAGSALQLRRVHLSDSVWIGSHVASAGVLNLHSCSLRNLTSTQAPVVLAWGNTNVLYSSFDACVGYKSGGALSLLDTAKVAAVASTSFRFCRTLGWSSGSSTGPDAGDGGALYSEQSIDLRDCSFEYCSSTKSGGGVNIEAVSLL